MLRESQLEQINIAIESLSKFYSTFPAQQKNLDLLQSVSSGLYDEVDKLAKKSPADQISSLVLTQVNDVIREAKELALNDPYMQRYAIFVAAGDNPEHRDVVVMLRQIRQGLSRFETSFPERKRKTDALLQDAKGIRIALLYALRGETKITNSHLSANSADLSTYWKVYSQANDEYIFNFDRLDSTNIATYFQPPE